MKHKATTAAVALAVLALAAWLLTRERGAPLEVAGVETPPPSTDVETLRGRPIGLAPGAKPPIDDLLARSRPSPPNAPPVRPSELRVTGRVIGADGKRVGGGMVWLVEPAWLIEPGHRQIPGRVLGEARVGPDGTYVLTAEPKDPVSSSALRLCVALDGEQSLWLAAPVTLGAAAVIDVQLPSDRYALGGRVTDSDGKPVADLALRLTDAWTSEQWVPLAVVPAASEVTSTRGETRFGRARTDSDGRFSVRVQSPQRLGVVSESPDWFIRIEPRDYLGRGLDYRGQTIDVRAEPAVTLAASVRDAKSGEAVPAFEGHAHDASSSMFVPFDGTAGVLAIRWPRWWKADERVTIQLDVEAKEYAPAQAFVVFEAGAREAKTDVLMKPATPDARADVTFDIRDSKGQPFDGDWVARIVDARNADKTVMELKLERVGAGEYRAPIPAGRWPLLVKTGDGLGFIRREFEADVVAGVPATIRCDMPAYGSLKLLWPAPKANGQPGSSTEPWLSVTPANGAGGSMLPIFSKGHEYRAPALPEGDWKLEFFPAGLESKPYERTARIVAGTETTIDFEKP